MAAAQRSEAMPGWRRSVVAAVAAQLLAILGFSCFFAFLPLYVQTLGIDSPARAAVWAGTLNFCQGIAVAVCSPIWGAVADRYGAKLMVERALFGGGLLFVIISWATSVQQLVVLFIIVGCFTGVNTAIVTLVSSVAPRERLGVVIGTCQTAVFSGASIGPTIGGLIADSFGYRVAIRVGATLLLSGGIVALLGIRERARLRGAGRRPGLIAAFRGAGFSTPLYLLIGLIFCIQFATQMISPVMPIFISQLLPSSERVATLVGVVLGAGGVSAAVGAYVCGRAADRYGQRRVLLWATGGGAAMLALQGLVTTLVQLAALRGVAGLFTGGLSAGTNASIGALVAPGSRGAAFGVSGSAFSLGNAFGPLLGGFLMAAFGPRIVLGASALSLVLGWLIVRALGRYERRATAVVAPQHDISPEVL